MWKDPIVEEVRKNRDQTAKKKGYSLKKIFADVKRNSAKKVRRSSLKK